MTTELHSTGQETSEKKFLIKLKLSYVPKNFYIQTIE